MVRNQNWFKQSICY